MNKIEIDKNDKRIKEILLLNKLMQLDYKLK
jgi:hypothetical protein